jgi:hypothetical protein
MVIDIGDFASYSVQHGTSTVFVQLLPTLFTQSFNIPQPLCREFDRIRYSLSSLIGLFSEDAMKLSVHFVGGTVQLSLFRKLHHAITPTNKLC